MNNNSGITAHHSYKLTSLKSAPLTHTGTIPEDHNFWSPEKVQHEITTRLNTPEFKGSPHAAYLAVYRQMTDARDKARNNPNSPMYPQNLLDKKLNDALSDIMTRAYLSNVDKAVGNPYPSNPSLYDLGGNFKNLHDTAQKNNWDAVRIALGSTGLYLSQHLALSLSTLPHIDSLWKNTPYQTIPERIERLKSFRPTYNAFNKFLEENLETVVTALQKENLIHGSRLHLAVQALKNKLPWRDFFGNVRDNAFNAGIKIALHANKETHPWLSHSKPAAPHPELLQELNKLNAYSNHLCKLLTLPVIGLFEGKKFSDVQPQPVPAHFSAPMQYAVNH